MKDLDLTKPVEICGLWENTFGGKMLYSGGKVTDKNIPYLRRALEGVLANLSVGAQFAVYTNDNADDNLPVARFVFRTADAVEAAKAYAKKRPEGA